MSFTLMQRFNTLFLPGGSAHGDHSQPEQGSRKTKGLRQSRRDNRAGLGALSCRKERNYWSNPRVEYVGSLSSFTIIAETCTAEHSPTQKDGATNQWRRGQSTFQGYDSHLIHQLTITSNLSVQWYSDTADPCTGFPPCTTGTDSSDFSSHRTQGSGAGQSCICWTYLRRQTLLVPQTADNHWVTVRFRGSSQCRKWRGCPHKVTAQA